MADSGRARTTSFADQKGTVHLIVLLPSNTAGLPLHPYHTHILPCPLNVSMGGYIVSEFTSLAHRGAQRDEYAVSKEQGRVCVSFAVCLHHAAHPLFFAPTSGSRLLLTTWLPTCQNTLLPPSLPLTSYKVHSNHGSPCVVITNHRGCCICWLVHMR